MREIKFRGKSVDTKDWVYGNIILDDGKAYICNSPETSNDYGEGTDFYLTEWYEVDLSTVGQYTGLKDKNGQEIYEGDIVRSYNSNTVVEYGLQEFEGDHGALFEFMGYNIEVGSGYPTSVKAELVVIGNIHENPELLKGDNL